MKNCFDMKMRGLAVLSSGLPGFESHESKSEPLSLGIRSADESRISSGALNVGALIN